MRNRRIQRNPSKRSQCKKFESRWWLIYTFCCNSLQKIKKTCKDYETLLKRKQKVRVRDEQQKDRSTGTCNLTAISRNNDGSSLSAGKKKKKKQTQGKRSLQINVLESVMINELNWQQEYMKSQWIRVYGGKNEYWQLQINYTFSSTQEEEPWSATLYFIIHVYYIYNLSWCMDTIPGQFHIGTKETRSNRNTTLQLQGMVPTENAINLMDCKETVLKEAELQL